MTNQTCRSDILSVCMGCDYCDKDFSYCNKFDIRCSDLVGDECLTLRHKLEGPPLKMRIMQCEDGTYGVLKITGLAFAWFAQEKDAREYVNWRCGVKMRYCEKCGAPITDGHVKKAAKLCKSCREKSRGNVVRKSVGPAIPIVEKYLKDHDYPETIRPLTILDEHPELFGIFGIDKTDRRMLWVISNAIKYIETPSGHIYTSPSQKKRRYFDKTLPEETL